MGKYIEYPYTLEKKDGAIRLTTRGRDKVEFLYVLIFLLVSILLLTFIWAILWGPLGVRLIYIGLIHLIAICWLLNLYFWERKGVETFILSANRLEYIQERKFKKTKNLIYHFHQIEIGYQSGEDFYSEEEAIELGVELDLEKVEGSHPIQFYMDNGMEVIDSEREIPIEVIRKIRDEYLLIQAKRDK